MNRLKDILIGVCIGLVLGLSIGLGIAAHAYGFRIADESSLPQAQRSAGLMVKVGRG